MSHLHKTPGVSKIPGVWAAAAARNNAAWCDTVCRAHGRPGEFLPGLWVNRHAAPRFYPNAVTLAAGDEAAVVERLRELDQAGLPDGWAVKDSFRALDLTSLGYHVLFEAEWIWRPAGLPPPGASLTGVRWSRVQSEPELAGWEAAWGSAPGEDRLFPPLLLSGAHAFLGAYRDGQIVAGAIANQSDGVVGVSNIFGLDGQSAGIWAGAVAMAEQVFPGRPLVGYEGGAELEAAQSAGFMTVGPLRVWGKNILLF